jgi:hypothetical protein
MQTTEKMVGCFHFLSSPISGVPERPYLTM